MKKTISIILVILIVSLIAPAASMSAKPRHGTGCIPPTREEAASYPVAPVRKGAGLPACVDLSDKFPPPGDQGEQSSCTGWAVGYAMMTYYKNIEFDRDVTLPANQFSPSYIYNQIYIGVDEGSKVADAAMLFFTQGACSIQSMPYDLYDYSAQPTYANHMEALKYKVKSWGFIYNAANIKAYLAEGTPVILTFPTYENFYNFTPAKNIYTKYEGKHIGHHAVCLVGYDDAKSAYKFINSWGTLWGLSGYGYISYSLVSSNLYPKTANDRTAMYAYEITDRRGIDEEDDYGDVLVNAHKWALDPSAVNSIDGRAEVSGFSNMTPSGSYMRSAKHTTGPMEIRGFSNIIPRGNSYERVESDLFAFTAPKAGTLRVWSSKSTVPMCGALYNTKGALLKIDDKRNGGGNEFLYEYNVVKGSTYYIQCYPWYAVGTYTMNAAYTVKAAGVTLNKSSITIVAGDTLELIATVSPSNATDKGVKWKSSDIKIATVDANGKVKAIKAGSAVITVTTNDGGKTAQCKVKVLNPVIYVAVAQNTIYLKKGTSAKPGAAAVTSDGSKAALTWKSDAPDIVSVDKYGTVKALKSGKADITATAENGIYAEIEVIVGGSAPASVSIRNKPANNAMKVNDELPLSIKIKPADAQGALIFKSSNASILSVDAAGQIKALKKGSAAITVTLGIKKTTLQITVK